MARKNTQQTSSKPDVRSDAANGSHVYQSMSDPSFDPLRGVTFKENPNSDVAVVGKGYVEEQQGNEARPFAGKPRKQQPKKGTVGIAALLARHVCLGSFCFPNLFILLLRMSLIWLWAELLISSWFVVTYSEVEKINVFAFIVLLWCVLC